MGRVEEMNVIRLRPIGALRSKRNGHKKISTEKSRYKKKRRIAGSIKFQNDAKSSSNQSVSIFDFKILLIPAYIFEPLHAFHTHSFAFPRLSFLTLSQLTSLHISFSPSSTITSLNSFNSNFIMYADPERLLPGEQRSRNLSPSVDEATSLSTPRSVRSIRKRFEAAPYSTHLESKQPPKTVSSAPTTPAKKHPAAHSRPSSKSKQRSHQTKTQAQLAAFLKSGTSQNDRNSGNKLDTPNSANVGSLIQKWSSPTAQPSSTQNHPDRQPLLEKHLQKSDDHSKHPPPPPPQRPALDSVDTFGSSSVEIDNRFPKTDPGRLESYAAQMHLRGVAVVQYAADAVVSGDASLMEMVAKGLQQHQNHLAAPSTTNHQQQNHQNQKHHHHQRQRHQQKGKDRRETRASPIPNKQPLSSPELQTSAVSSQSEAGSLPRSGSRSNPIDDDHEEPEVVVADSDWGAGDMYIRELFAEAEDTAERAVESDENEEYFKAFELYWVVVDLYYKVIPFLTPEEGVDVQERIKMYTKRCQVIRAAFGDDPEGQDEIEVRIQDASQQSRQKEFQLQESFNTGIWEHSHNHVQPQAQVEDVQTADIDFQNQHHQRQAPAHHQQSLPNHVSAGRPPLQHTVSHSQLPFTQHEEQQLPQMITQSRSQANIRYQSQEEIHREKQPPNVQQNANQGVDNETNTRGELQRVRYPDYVNNKPLVSIPDAPRSVVGGLSTSTEAHRNSLSRPISKSAVRASTNSISRERVAEMQERVNIMQECLTNFTVKKKHLGPAKALELHVTTLNANTFGDLKKLEPLPQELEHKWASELEVLLSMLQEVKEVQPGKGHVLREDIAKHLPALERCDSSVRKTMRSFSALSSHVTYKERETGENSTHGGRGRRRWWVKVPVVRKGGLPPDVFRIVEEAEKEMRGVFKICHEINVEVVKSMPVPASFAEALPKHARALISRELKEGLTVWGMFKVSDYMKDRNIWNKDAAKDITSSLEKVALIWEAKTSNKSFFSRTFDIRGERFQQAMTAFRRCQIAIKDLRREW